MQRTIKAVALLLVIAGPWIKNLNGQVLLYGMTTGGGTSNLWRCLFMAPCC